MQVFYWTLAFNSLEYIVGVELLGHMVIWCLIFEKPPNCLPISQLVLWLFLKLRTSWVSSSYKYTTTFSALLVVYLSYHSSDFTTYLFLWCPNKLKAICPFLCHSGQPLPKFVVVIYVLIKLQRPVEQKANDYRTINIFTLNNWSIYVLVS